MLHTEQGGRWLGLGGLLGGLAFAVLAWLLAGAAIGLSFYEAVFTVLRQQVPAPARRTATLPVTLMARLASTIFVPLTAALLGGGSLRVSLLGLSGLPLLAGLLVWHVVPGRPPSASSSVPEAFTPEPLFRRLVVSFSLSRIVTTGTGLQLAPLQLTAGHPPAVAAGLTGLLGLADLPGRLIFLPLLGQLGLWPLTLGLIGLMAVGTAALHFAPSTALSAAGQLYAKLEKGRVCWNLELERERAPVVGGIEDNLLARRADQGRTDVGSDGPHTSLN
ncbi:hypothetical protein GCM10022631_26060 [Deinococcus rubellus]|uniref:hypothetical protein n=1 Tax=Deinococcus rubellus TaxID=1889240 RepID=UPI0031ECC9D9